jgi:ribonuclease BN (tRNA processing enzyme)
MKAKKAWGQTTLPLKIVLMLALLLLVVATKQVRSSVCADSSVCLQVLGSGGPELGDQRASSSYLIWVNGKAKVLIDVGAGSSLNFEKSGAKFEDLEAILFTHFHVYHSVDLPAFIKASFFTARDRDLPIFGPGGNSLMPSTAEFVQNLFGVDGAFRYLKDYINTSETGNYHLQTHDLPMELHRVQTYRLTADIVLKAIPVHHGELIP